jgi:hypothetical protein
MVSSLSKYALCLSLVLFGCNSKSLIKYDTSNCNTTIEGNFHTPPIYKYYSPAILFKKDSKKNYKMGSVISSDSNGVYFVEKKLGPFHNPDTLYFEYSQLRAIVDDNKFCIWGNLDEKEIDNVDSKQIKLELYKIDSTNNNKYTYVELTSNSSFSYCLLPGNYFITRIIEGDEKDTYKETIPLTLFKFHAVENEANYIGDLHFVGSYDINDSTFSIPNRKQTGNFILVTGDPFTTAFGLLISGAAALKNSNEGKGNNYYNINIRRNDLYKSQTNLKLANRSLEPFINYEK